VSLSAPILLLPYFAWKSKGIAQLSERTGSWKLTLPDGFAWFHGASVGEVNSLLPVIKRWREIHPEVFTLLTATTTTGINRGKEAVHETRLLPLDHPRYIARALNGAIPRIFVFGECELWAELLTYLQNRGVKTFLINGRMSERSVRRYRHFTGILVPVISRVSHLCVGTEASRKRFVSLGADKGRSTVTGTSKYDIEPKEIRKRGAESKFFKVAGKILVLGSIRPKEEEIWFPPLKDILSSESSLRVIVAPRHPEKFVYFAEQLEKYGIDFARYSEGLPTSHSCLLLDTLGQMERAYSEAELSFVGGTLFPEYGGHNPLEAAMYSNGIVLGPHGSTIEEVRSDLEKADAAERVESVNDVQEVVSILLTNKNRIDRKGTNAYGVWQRYRGATSRIIEILERP